MMTAGPQAAVQPAMSGALSKRQQLNVLRGQLDIERSSFMPQWRELGDYILPRRPRFTVTDVNRGDRRNQKIIDSTGTIAARTLRSGMMSGVTSPARPWFRLTTPNPDLADYGPVKDWLYLVSQHMATVYLKSNIYNVLPILYGDMGVFATSAMAIEEDFEDTIRCYPFAIGSYMIAQDHRLKVNVFHRDFRLTVRQLIQKFGQTNRQTGSARWDNFSVQVRNLWDNGNYEAWIDVRHTIRPNPDFDPKRPESKFKQFDSSYYEAGSSGSTDAYQSQEVNGIYLSEKGYDYFPVLCPRWEINAEDVYGTSCPGMDSIGDIKQGQIGEKRSAQAIEKMVNPPMIGPTSLRNQKATILPGDVTYLDVREGQQGFRPAHEVRASISELEQKQTQVRDRVRQAFYADLFLMLSESDRRQITAREVEERHEEKLLALGPVLEQLNQDLLDPLIDITFMMMQRQGKIPPPPKELEGQPLRVDYLSIMAQAQKLVGIQGVERFAQFVGQLQATHPESGDKVDTDQLVEIYGEMTSIPPGIIRPQEQVDQIRAQRQQAQQAQQQAETIQQGAQAAKSLSQADLSGDNALTHLMEQAQAGQVVPQ